MANETRFRGDGVAGQLSSGISIGATSMSAAALADLPAVSSSQYVAVTLYNTDATGRITKREVVHITAHTSSATSATIVKAQEGTTDQAWSTTDPFAASACAKDFASSNYVQAQRYTANGIAIASDDEFDQGVLSGSWTHVGMAQGTDTWTEGGEVLSVAVSNQVASAFPAQLKAITISAGGYIETAVRFVGNSSGGIQAGLVLTNGLLSSSSAVVAVVGNTGAGFMNWKFGNATLGSQSGGNSSSFPFVGPAAFLRLKWTSSNTFDMYISTDGISWIQINSGMSAMSFTMTPTQMGVVATTNGNAGSTMASFEYFRASA